MKSYINLHLYFTFYFSGLFFVFSDLSILKKQEIVLQYSKDFLHLHRLYAQMAELVDALVSNTSGFTSIPVRPRVWVLKRRK